MFICQLVTGLKKVELKNHGDSIYLPTLRFRDIQSYINSLMRGSGVQSRGQLLNSRTSNFQPSLQSPNYSYQGTVTPSKTMPLFPPGTNLPSGGTQKSWIPQTNRPIYHSQVGGVPQPIQSFNKTSLLGDLKVNQLPPSRQKNMSQADIKKSQVIAPTLTKSFQNEDINSSTPKKMPQILTATTINSLPLSVGSFGNSPYKNPLMNNLTSLEKIQNGFHFSYCFKTQKGFNPTFNKENQDTLIALPNLNNREWQHFFAVGDGHGENGHLISRTLRNYFTEVLSNNPNFYFRPQENLYMSFRGGLERCIKENIDLSASGSTFVGCYLINRKLYCANVGDSRAIIGSVDHKSGKWAVRTLSNDHKPSLPSEAERIKRCNGRIDYLRDRNNNPVGPLRIWFQQTNAPGLAMSRSIGDLIAAQVGLTWEPEILESTITPNDRILIIASDGLWEFLSNQQVINLVSTFYENNSLEEASKLLMEYATQSWKKNTTIIDDITFTIVFLKHD